MAKDDFDKTRQTIKALETPDLKELQKQVRKKVYEQPESYTRAEVELAMIEHELFSRGGVSLVRS